MTSSGIAVAVANSDITELRTAVSMIVALARAEVREAKSPEMGPVMVLRRLLMTEISALIAVDNGATTGSTMLETMSPGIAVAVGSPPSTELSNEVSILVAVSSIEVKEDKSCTRGPVAVAIISLRDEAPPARIPSGIETIELKTSPGTSVIVGSCETNVLKAPVSTDVAVSRTEIKEDSLLERGPVAVAPISLRDDRSPLRPEVAATGSTRDDMT